MAKKRAFVKYTKQGKIVPGSLVLTSGTYPDGPALWQEVPTDLCCETSAVFPVTTTTTIPVTTTTIPGSTAFSVRRNNTGLCASSGVTTIYSNSSVLAPNVSVYNDIALTSPIAQFTYICDCVNGIYYVVTSNNTLGSGLPITCI